jgi:hypothetical protein
MIMHSLRLITEDRESNRCCVADPEGTTEIVRPKRFRLSEPL